MTTKIVFMGSPEFAVPTLQTLAQNYPIVGVITQPDQPAGRGRVMTPPPIKTLAEQLGLPVIQPRRLRDPEPMAQLHAWNPDLIVVAAFGQILRANVLDLPPHGCINVHASLLPRWRGAAPIQASILHGDAETGVTIMKMDPGIDTGPTLTRRALPITPDDTAETLSTKLAHLGADLLLETLPAYLRGTLLPQPQDDTHATYAPMLKKEDGALDFTQPAENLAWKVRAYNPWPGAYLEWAGGTLKVHLAHAERGQAVTGQFLRAGKLPAVGTASGVLVFDEVQPPGKKPMPGQVFLNGARDWGMM
ncbi:MAG TPA: methionyl-tRNA formyltransferase [Anaerolineales bacterium]|nr:methionyl-tRNA formyltransferase [Anaerolineales bacterium]